MKKEETLKRNLNHKCFLIILKIIPHIIALFYAIYIFSGFLGIDLLILSYFIHVSILPWIGLYLLSFIFRYCYVHRLPLYYILINEILTITDYYLHIPIDTSNLFIIYLLVTVILIFGYTIFYIRTKIDINDETIQKRRNKRILL